MRFRTKLFQSLLIIVMILSALIGIFRMGGLQSFQSARKIVSSLAPLSEGWKCQEEDEGVSFDTDLPAILPLHENARSITLTNTLPSTIQNGDALRLQTLSGWYEIYIDGIIRFQYGNREITNAYWYDNASAILLIKLTENDAGKPITILTGSIDSHHLSIQREPLIGTDRDFLMANMVESSYGNMLIIVLAVAGLFLLAVWLFFYLKKQRIHLILPCIGFLVMMLLYYNVGNLFMLEVFNYTPRYFGFNDFVYYVMNVFLPFAGYLIILPKLEKLISKYFGIFLTIHTLLALVAYGMQVLWVTYYETIEILTMLTTITGYLWLFIQGKPWRMKGAERWFILSVFICIGAYILDYGKYMLNLDWLPASIANYLQVESPFMIFLPFAMIIFIIMILVGVVQIITERQTKLVLEAEGAVFRATLAEREHYAAISSINQIRKLRHDMEHHFSVINGYLAEKKTEEAESYIQSVTSLLPNRPLTNKNFVTGCFIEQYRLLCEQNNIQFLETISYDEELISNKTILGIILGNGLKNAFESASLTQKDLRFIKIIGKQVHDNIIIVIQNGFDHSINPTFKSTKSKDRGFGMANMKDAAETGGGYIDCSYEDSTFTLKVVLVIAV